MFINASYKNIEQYQQVAFSLVDFVFQEIVEAEVEEMFVVFGDNMMYVWDIHRYLLLAQIYS